MPQTHAVLNENCSFWAFWPLISLSTRCSPEPFAHVCIILAERSGLLPLYGVKRLSPVKARLGETRKHVDFPGPRLVSCGERRNECFTFSWPYFVLHYLVTHNMYQLRQAHGAVRRLEECSNRRERELESTRERLRSNLDCCN